MVLLACCIAVSVCCISYLYVRTRWRCCKQIKTMHGRAGVETAITGGGGGGGVLAVTRHISLAWGCWESSPLQTRPVLAWVSLSPSMHQVCSQLTGPRSSQTTSLYHTPSHHHTITPSHHHTIITHHLAQHKPNNVQHMFFPKMEDF